MKHEAYPFLAINDVWSKWVMRDQRKQYPDMLSVTMISTIKASCLLPSVRRPRSMDAEIKFDNKSGSGGAEMLCSRDQEIQPRSNYVRSITTDTVRATQLLQIASCSISYFERLHNESGRRRVPCWAWTTTLPPFDGDLGEALQTVQAQRHISLAVDQCTRLD